jgi:Na+/proline symporter
MGIETVSFSTPKSIIVSSWNKIQYLTYTIHYRYQHEVQTSEMFSTAGRSVKSGLVAAAVVSSWTWAATLLQSSAVAYKYGISGPFFYASGEYR